MTKLEEQFFKTFGIEPLGCSSRETNRLCTGTLDCSECTSTKYPKITADVLLCLICMVINHYDYPRIINVKHLEQKTLSILIKLKKENDYYGYERQNNTLIKKVRSLFEEVNNE